MSNSLRIPRNPRPHLIKLPLTNRPHLLAPHGIHSLHSQLQPPAHRPVVADTDLPPAVLFHLHLAQATEEYAITPGRSPALLARVLVVGVDVVLVGRREGDGTLLECAQPETRILLSAEEKLVAFE